ncbi:hypothetical protein [Algirhabdus cladophorae]|uniref:hypothetical protein n=1 Tax=Algirhabdus cladophorae TaxID=3377108 RepID=UPI003B8459A0
MTSVEDIRYIIGMALIGVGLAFLKAPLVVTLLTGFGLGCALFPYFILNPTLKLFQSLRPGVLSSVVSILRGNSNLPQRQSWVILGALAVSGALFVLTGQVFAELFLPRFMNVTMENRDGMSIAILAGVLLGLFKMLQFYGKRLRDRS